MIYEFKLSKTRRNCTVPKTFNFSFVVPYFLYIIYFINDYFNVYIFLAVCLMYNNYYVTIAQYKYIINIVNLFV